MAQWNKINQDYLNQERSLFEVYMCADRYGNIGNCGLGGTGNTSGDAFGRMRISQPFTMFDSSVEYKLNGTGITGGRILESGFFNSSNQSSPSINILKESLFAFQLERNGLTGTPYELTVVVAAAPISSSENVFVAMDWEEVSR
jgi:hypothetical protein